MKLSLNAVLSLIFVSLLLAVHVFSQSSTAVLNIVPSPPTIVNYEISPKAVIVGHNVSITINATDINGIDKKFATITKPNGTKQTVNLPVNYTATDIGRYNVTLFVNNTIGLLVNVTDYFISEERIIINLTIFNALNNGVSTNITFLFDNNTIATVSSSNGTINDLALPSVKVDLTITSYQAEVLLRNVNLTKGPDERFGFDKLNTPISMQKVTYGIENPYKISSANLKIFYNTLSFTNEDNLKIAKCSAWDFTNRTCIGDFIILNAVQNKPGNSLSVETLNFSGWGIIETQPNQIIEIFNTKHTTTHVNKYINNTVFRNLLQPYATTQYVNISQPSCQSPLCLGANYELLLVTIEAMLVLLLIMVAFLIGRSFSKKR